MGGIRAIAALHPKPGTIETTRADDVLVLELRGEHDLSTRPDLAVEFDRCFQSGARVIVDLTAVEFIDGTVLNVLVTGGQEADVHVERLAVVAAPETPAHRLLTLTGVHDLIPTYPTRAKALNATGWALASQGGGPPAGRARRDAAAVRRSRTALRGALGRAATRSWSPHARNYIWMEREPVAMHATSRDLGATHEAAAGSHEQAAARHLEAMDRWLRRDEFDLAELERRNAHIEAQAAQLERDRAAVLRRRRGEPRASHTVLEWRRAAASHP